MGGEGIRKGTVEIWFVTSAFHLAPSPDGYLVCDDFEMFLSCAIKYKVVNIAFVLRVQHTGELDCVKFLYIVRSAAGVVGKDCVRIHLFHTSDLAETIKICMNAYKFMFQPLLVSFNVIIPGGFGQNTLNRKMQR